MLFWLVVVAVVAFSWGFAAGATHEQYKPIAPKRRDVVTETQAEWDELRKMWKQYLK